MGKFIRFIQRGVNTVLPSRAKYGDDAVARDGTFYTIDENKNLVEMAKVAAKSTTTGVPAVFNSAGELKTLPGNTLNAANIREIANFQNLAIPYYTLTVGSGKLSDIFKPDTAALSASNAPSIVRVTLNTTDPAEMERAGLPSDGTSAQHWLILRFGSSSTESVLIAFGEDKQGTALMSYKNIQSDADIDGGTWQRVVASGENSGNTPILGANAPKADNTLAAFNASGRIKSAPTVGNENTPIYLNNGVPTAITEQITAWTPPAGAVTIS